MAKPSFPTHVVGKYDTESIRVTVSGGWRSQGCLVTFSATVFCLSVSSTLKPCSHKHNHRLATFSYAKQAQGNKAYASAVTLEEIWKYSRWRMKCLCLPHVGSQAQAQGMEKVSFLALTLMLISCRFPHDCSYAYAYAYAYFMPVPTRLFLCLRLRLCLFHAGSHTIVLMLTLMLVLIAQVGTRL